MRYLTWILIFVNIKFYTFWDFKRKLVFCKLLFANTDRIRNSFSVLVFVSMRCELNRVSYGKKWLSLKLFVFCFGCFLLLLWLILSRRLRISNFCFKENVAVLKSIFFDFFRDQFRLSRWVFSGHPDLLR